MEIRPIAQTISPFVVGALTLACALGGCGKAQQKQPADPGQARAEAKRQRAACASSTAYDRLKGVMFDRAIAENDGNRANLDTLADYSLARMEEPVVTGWDRELDIVSCRGRFILDVPPGAERGFDGERRLTADVEYTAQAAADGNGFVYKLEGAETIIARLGEFNLRSVAYRPPPAIDNAGGPNVEQTAIDPGAAPPRAAPTQPAMRLEPVPTAPRPRDIARAQPVERSPAGPAGTGGEATVRAFYNALGAGNGTVASAQVIPEKRSSRAYSPQAITRFYGSLAEPIRVTEVVPLAEGAYRVRYRYSAGRSRCNGSAVVRLTRRGERELIRSIEALDGC